MTNEQLREVKMAWARGDVVQYNAGYGWLDWQESHRLNINHTAPFQMAWRIKPKTIRIGDYDVPEPLREPGEYEKVWAVSLGNFGDVFSITGHRAFVNNLFRRGVCHATRKAAELHAKALLSFTENK